MKYTKYKLALGVLLTATFLSVHGYPIINKEENLVNKDEKQYPNGTVIGKYTYIDNQGNPIDVKYYANNASYGVELKSVKIMNSDPNLLDTPAFQYPIKIVDHPFDNALDPFNGFKELLGFDNNLIREPIHTFKNKTNGNLKKNVEFEILLQNELKAPERCGKEKVKVYFDKDKRKTRNALKSHDSMSFCNRN